MTENLYNHALLILTEPSKSKNLLDLLSNTCQVSGSIMLLDILFSRSKASDANAGLLPMLCICVTF